MRPQKAKSIVQRAINDAVKGDTRRLYAARDAIEKLMWVYVSDDDDYRAGVDTYGYSEESNQNNLMYISDRFHCIFRLQWLLDGIDGSEF